MTSANTAALEEKNIHCDSQIHKLAYYIHACHTRLGLAEYYTKKTATAAYVMRAYIHRVRDRKNHAQVRIPH